jgi:hypothetical protein
MELEEIKKEEPWRCHATFYTVFTRNNLNKGFLIPRGNVKRLNLFDTDETDLKYLKEGEKNLTRSHF